MQGNIGGVEVAAWVEHILSRVNQVGKDGKLNSSTEGLSNSLTIRKPLKIATGRRMETISGPRSSGTKKSEGPGQPARELNHVVPATWPPQMNQGQTVYRQDMTVSNEFASSDSDNGTVSLSPVQSSPVPDGQEERQANADKQVVQRTLAASEPRLQPPANLKEVIADRVYRMMQKDLLLERDRANKVGG